MNIKRAFLAAIAVLMMPAYAMAQTTFLTDVQLSNGGDATVTATLTCNSGVPLVQSFDISPGLGNGVGFVVAGLVAGTDCDIAITSVNGYAVVLADANNDLGTGPACLFPGIDADTTNTCDFLMAPLPFTYRVEKVWPVGDLNEVSQLATFNWTCTNVALDPDTNVFIDIDGDATLDGAGSFAATLFADPVGGSNCVTIESAFDSAVESDQGCRTPVHFEIGDTLKGCTINNSVFFEGIPTLSQYGMAIMVLLMLGVGFVGFRRFV